MRLVVYPVIYKVLYMAGGAGFLPSAVPYPKLSTSLIITYIWLICIVNVGMPYMDPMGIDISFRYNTPED